MAADEDEKVSVSRSKSIIWNDIRWKDIWPPTGYSLGFYIAVEATWHVTLFSLCYRYRPLYRLGQTPWGRHFTASAQRRLPPWVKRVVPAGERAQRYTIAATEWFFFNKVIGIPLWPSKLLLAGVAGAQYEKELQRRETMRKENHRQQQQQILASSRISRDDMEDLQPEPSSK